MPTGATVLERGLPNLHARSAARAGDREYAILAGTRVGGVTALQTISIVADFGRVLAGQLSTFDFDAFLESTRAALRAAGIDRYLLGVDISLNHEAGQRDKAYFQFQLWGFFDVPSDPRWRVRLKAQVNSTGRVARPVKVVIPDSVEAAAAYGLKSAFNRRVSCIKANLHRQDRGSCRNTHACPLRGEAWVELMIFLDRIGIENRVLSHGLSAPFQPLMSR